MQRLDKILAHMGCGTRTEIKKALKRGILTVNGKVVKDSAVKVDPVNDVLIYDGEQIVYKEFVYIMLNKPQGVVSATEDTRDETVIDIVSSDYGNFDVFPMGRLDKDTEGLLILTNDGKFAHEILSPKKHVPKKYFVRVSGLLDEKDISAFDEGIVIDDGYKTMPGALEILTAADISEAYVVIKEGKFHQVKRMFAARGKEVIYLKRIAMGRLDLDESLDLGAYRELTEEEKELLQQRD